MSETVARREGPIVGALDIVLLASFLGVAGYWLYGRRKKAAESDIDLVGLKPIPRGSIWQKQISSDSSFVTKMQRGGKQIAIFYGSQTGTAEEFAGRLSKDVQKYGMKAQVLDPEECDMEDLPLLKEDSFGDKTLVIFVMATYGEGDPTDNAQAFYEWLHEDQDLEGLNFAVFGLGNKTYEHYNSMGRYVDKRLEELGGTRVYERGEGDDDGNIEEDFVTWRESFWPAVCDFFDIHMDKVRIQRSLSVTATREFELKILKDIPETKIFNGEISKVGAFTTQKPPYDAKNPFLAQVKINRELHSGGSDRSCMHIELDISGSGIRYDAGDHVGIYPTNDPELVEKLGKLLNVDLDTVISLDNVDVDAQKKNPFPCPTTYRTALLHYLDISSCVKTHILTELVYYASDNKEKELLQKLVEGDEEGKNKYNEWIVKDHRTIVGLLEDLPSVKPPLDHLLELLPRLQCRYYSISSSSKMYPSSIHVTAVVVDWTSRIGRRQKGVATTWLQTKIPEEDNPPKVPIFVRKTQFRLPRKPATPAIFIGPGTGLAPMRGFIQERHLQKANCPVGETVLFFGCRHKDQDYLYQNELESYLKDGTLTKLHVAFSRDQEKKIYVQHKLEEDAKYVWNLLQKGAHVYVCGDARNMARDVHDTLQNILKDFGDMSLDEAGSFLKNMGNTGKYCVDVWS